MSHRVCLLFGALALATAVGCEDDFTDTPDSGQFSDGAVAVTHVSGYVWDAEAYWLALANCAPPGEMCQLPPIVLPGTPLYAQAAVPNAIIGLFDPLQPMQLMPLPFMAVDPTGFDGGWHIENVTRRPNPPFLPVVGAVLPKPSPLPTDPTYLTTMTLKPIATNGVQCLSQAAGVVSDSGALEAVAKAMTLGGTTTTVADLLDPTKTGGVVVWWLWMPGPPVLRVPAFGATMQADMGTTFTIAWLPPGLLPPAVQSKRGFFVTSGPAGPADPPRPGLSVTVLPPLMGPPPMIQFTPMDPVTDEASGRPFSFPPLPPMQLGPGIATFGELQGATPGQIPPPFICLPSG
jgi:hypothetical protein